ncbi:hypothetical protein BDL97_03G051800 [Sphagnum fallax]|nr:hypothetical protein BDL97_03G051800 [Sphagnum fallax]KAH8966918.1 hypothetical protein BDL97_03G051800 [Sphagnum fallax]
MRGKTALTADNVDFVDDVDYAAVSQSASPSAATTVKGGSDTVPGKSKGKGSMSLSGSMDSYQVVYVKENVSVYPTQHARERISGRLRLIKQDPSLFMTWIPYNLQGGFVKDGAFLLPNGGRRTGSDRNLYTIRAVSLAEMRSIRRHTPTLGWQYIIIVLTSGLAFPPLYFNNGGVREFLATLKAHAILVRSNDDANVYLVNDVQDPLQRSLMSLELTEVARVPAVVASTSKDDAYPVVRKQDQDQKNEVDGNSNLNSMGLSEDRQHKQSKDPARDLSIQVLEKFSMVTKFARDTSAHLFGESRLLGNSEMDFDRAPNRFHEDNSSASRSSSLPPDRIAVQEPSVGPGQILVEDSPEQQEDEKSDAEEQAATNVGTFELVDGTQNDSPALVWGRARPPPLGNEEWMTFLDSEGRVMDPRALKKRIFYGGVEQKLRHVVWKFLLGYYNFDSTHTMRKALVVKKREEYRVLKSQWQSVSEDQAKRFAKFRERKHRVEKDVVRTDRMLPFYDGDDNPNVELLRNILVTYSFYNFDLGYCQGMSDLLSPILYVMEDESEAFWCFAALMERMAPNFHRDQNGMHSQLLAISKLVQLLDNPLHDYFKQNECLNYFFCFRWILIHFKREFDYDNVLRLWEVLWSNYLSEHFHLYMCVALLKRHRRKIMDEQMEFDTLLKFINELSGHIDLESTLRDAEALCLFAGEKGAACITLVTPAVSAAGPET